MKITFFPQLNLYTCILFLITISFKIIKMISKKGFKENTSKQKIYHLKEMQYIKKVPCLLPTSQVRTRLN